MEPAETHPPSDASPVEAQAMAEPDAGAGHPHNFDVQKELHQKIRNDPDYDDWEYGTEPLPHEAWLKARPSKPSEPG
ncbi:MAG: hypothetical protein WCQ20_00700 [Synechococcaceae cyanobacterium ELA739]|jgi:hypothetical protein